MAVCAMRILPSSHGPPPKPPSTGSLTARTTAAPATGPELVKSRSEAPASSKSFASSTSRAVELDQIGAAFLDQANGGAHRALRPFLQRTVGEIAAHQRTRDAAADRLADHEHLVHRDFERIGVSPQIDADRVSDRDDIYPGAIRDARELIIPGDHAYALSPVALHLQKRGNGDLVRHRPLFGYDSRRVQNFSTHGRSSISQAQALRG